ncbi:NAD(+) synthase [Bacillaceae bacterium W0354]
MDYHIEQLTKWLQNQVKEANVKGLIVGLSGGIDSALVGCLIKRAFPKDSLGVIMPCHSSDEDVEHAKLVAEKINLNYTTIDLSTIHQSLFQMIKSDVKDINEWNDASERLADANLRARLRMSTIYTFATNYNYLVVGTDNKAEYYTGYFTKYGDGGVDLAPIIHYSKGEVRQMAKILGVPDEIINKAPSAGLWEGQTDEEEMGVSYDLIDRYLNGDNIPESDALLIEKMHKRTEHKRKIPTSPPDFHQFT